MPVYVNLEAADLAALKRQDPFTVVLHGRMRMLSGLSLFSIAGAEHLKLFIFFFIKRYILAHNPGKTKMKCSVCLGRDRGCFGSWQKAQDA